MTIRALDKLKIAFGLFLLIAVIFPVHQVQASPVRGVSGDLWADVVIGKRDFGEIAAREVVAAKVNNPSGVAVDRTVSPGRAYVWDSGNSRIIGVNLATCYGSGTTCSAELVIGQPSLADWGACNRDASYGDYPARIPAAANTLCGVSERTHTTLEDKTHSSMYVDDSGNLWVYDTYNHRVLKYNSPFTTDTVADDVWGQTDFTGNGCNLTGGIGGGWFAPAPQPTASSLCSATIDGTGAGVTLDSSGNLWVADGGNNRVLRFPYSGGSISHTADLVLGQTNFTTGGDWSAGTGLDEFHYPSAVRVDVDGKVYVADAGNNRILTFTAPFSNGMAGTVFGTGLNSPQTVELENNTSTTGIFTGDISGGVGRVKLWNHAGTSVQTEFTLPYLFAGSMGIDTLGNVIPASYRGAEVYKYEKQGNGSFLKTREFFSPPPGYNLISKSRLEQGGVGDLLYFTNFGGDQLIATDRRILFWNNAGSLTNGQPASGYVGGNSFLDLPDPPFIQMGTYSTELFYSFMLVAKGKQLWHYGLPLASGQAPIAIIDLSGPINVQGGGTTTLGGNIGGLVITRSGINGFLRAWISDTANHRVIRIDNVTSSSRFIDTIIGQTTSSGNLCNRGIIPEPKTGTLLNADRTMLCYPGYLRGYNNKLWVSDHYLEAEGNWRLLMFDGVDRTCPRGCSLLLAPAATKEFPRKHPITNPLWSHATFGIAFNNAGKMVTGYNPYLGPRFPEYYNNPAIINPSDPSDPQYASPSGSFSDFYGWATSAAFNPGGHLYLYDSNRGKIMKYLNPLP